MADVDKIFKRLQTEYSHVETFFVGNVEEPIWFACNEDADTFRVVSIFLGSEIGGEFKIEDGEGMMEYVCESFDKRQAFDLREVIIEMIESGNATMVGAIKPEAMH